MAMYVNRLRRFPVKSWASILEDEAQQQVLNIADLPFIHKHVAVMADAHAGKGSTVGTVIATRGAVIPAAVGVDIGCGMFAVRLPIPADALSGSCKAAALRSAIECEVPVGRAGNTEPCKLWRGFTETHTAPKAVRDLQRAGVQMGSLGGGNHFIEVCTDQEGLLWVVLHSGSRNIGKVMADVHINGAKGLMQRWFVELPDPDLAYLVQGTPEFGDYIHDLRWAQEYAAANRYEMMDRVLGCVFRALSGRAEPLLAINCHHNYTVQENHYGQNVWVTRKGAVSARAGEWGVIPGSMGTKTYVVQGTGNPESFHSCSHGAGRRMSRTQARKQFTLADLEAQTAGVECRKDSDVLDEIPGAYKDIDQVMADQADLVDVRYVLKQVLCVKG